MPEFDPYYKWLGISKEDQPASHYRLLGIREGESNLDVIENAADRQMVFLRQHAAGKHGSYATKLLNEVTRARLVLLNAEMKSAYDRGLHLSEPKITSQAPAPILSETSSGEALENNNPQVNISEQTDESAPIVTSSTNYLASDRLRGRAGRSSNQRGKNNFHWVIACTGVLIVGLIFLVIVINSLSSSSDKPALAGGSDNNSPANKSPHSASPIDTRLGSATRDMHDDADTDLPVVIEDESSGSGSSGGLTTSLHTSTDNRPLPSSGDGANTVLRDPVRSGLKAYYSFSGNANDSAGKNNGTLNGDAAIVNDPQRGQVLSLDGNSDWVSFDEKVDLTSGEYTISLWFQTNSSGQRVLLALTSGSYEDHGLLLEMGRDDRLRYLHRVPFGTKGGTDIYSSQTFNYGQWHHLVLSKTATKMTMAIDGQMIGLATDATFFGEPLSMVVGRIAVNNPERYFKGKIDDLRIYDRAISAEEIAELSRVSNSGMP